MSQNRAVDWTFFCGGSLSSTSFCPTPTPIVPPLGRRGGAGAQWGVQHGQRGHPVQLNLSHFSTSFLALSTTSVPFHQPGDGLHQKSTPSLFTKTNPL